MTFQGRRGLQKAMRKGGYPDAWGDLGKVLKKVGGGGLTLGEERRKVNGGKVRKKGKSLGARKGSNKKMPSETPSKIRGGRKKTKKSIKKREKRRIGL